MLRLPLLVLLGSCTPDGVAVPVSHLLAPLELRFDEAAFGGVNTASLHLENTGLGPATVRLQAPAPFAVPDADLVVPARSAVDVVVTFVPDGYARATAELALTSERQHLVVPLVGRVDADLDDDGALARGAGGDDCDDEDPDARPGLPEVCDKVDNDCDGAIDDDAVDRGTWFLDADADGWGSLVTRRACARPFGYVERSGDCDDADPQAFPGAPEVWYDGKDQDCDGGSDFDRDGDGERADAWGGADCDDADPAVHPGADDPPYDGVDADCDGWSDGDVDRDGYDAAFVGGADCDDEDPLVHPGVREIDDGVDQDCDGLVDEDFVFRGHLVITEVLVAPVAVPGDAGQYLELHNRSRRTVELAGARVSAAAGIAVLGELGLPPGGVVVLCGDPDAGAVACDGPLPPLGLADRVELRLATVLDELDWSGWTATPGASWVLDAGALGPNDNDAPEAWCVATTDRGDGDLGTPGSVGDLCP